MNRLSGVAFIVVSSLAYGAMPIFVRLAYQDGASPTTVLWLRFSLAAVILIVYMAARRIPLPQWKTLWQLILLGLIGYVGQSLAYYLAIDLAPASLVVLLLYLSPVFVTLGSFLIFKERLSRWKILALILALLGALLTASAGSQMSSVSASGDGILPGILLGVTAAAVGAGYVLAGSRILASAPTMVATTVVISSTAAGYTVIAFSQGLALPQHWNGYAAIAALATVSTVFAIATFLAGLQRVGPANASTLGVLEPAFAVVLAAVILGETLFPAQIFGGALIAAGVVIISRMV